MNAAIAGLELDTPSDELEFISIHNLVAGATLYGTEVQGTYEYGGVDYAGRLQHVEAYSSCPDCHNIHRQEVKAEECGLCHPEVATLEDLVRIRIQENAVDFDGDGDTIEGIAGEIETMRDALYAAIQSYAVSVAGTPIVYQAHTSPYFFVDRNGNGAADPDELSDENRYSGWTPRLIRATYNYHYAVRDPGAFAHNPDYVLQVLHDSLEDLGGEVGGMVRP